MIIAISDIHGHYDAMMNLLDKLNHHPRVNFSTDQLIFLGDYVDGGNDTKEVVHTLRYYQQQNPHWVFLRGNHENMMLQARFEKKTSDKYLTWFLQGGKETIESYTHGLTEREIVDGADLLGMDSTYFWINSLPYKYESKSFIFVHAGLRPHVHLHHQTERDMTWIRGEFITSEYDFGKRVIYGHTYTPKPFVMHNKIGIDTMRHHEGYLTAVILDDDDPNYYEFVHSDH